jgi:CheY-like chemotaxis protein
MARLDGVNILIVEDDFFIAEDIVESLQLAGARIVGPAATLTEAQDLATRFPVDRVVLDVNLQRETTYPLAEVLRQRDVPFVFLTGYDRDAIDRRFSWAPVLNKPVDLSALLAALTDAPNRKRA